MPLFEAAVLDEWEVFLLVWLWRLGGAWEFDLLHPLAMSLYDKVMVGTVIFDNGVEGLELSPEGQRRAEAEWAGC